MSPHPVLDVFRRTVEVLDDERVESAVMGGLAIRYWALPRATYDVDFAVAADGVALRRCLEAFERAGFTVEPHHLAGFQDSLAGMRKVSVACFESGSVWRVDLFLASTPFLRSALSRRVPAEIEGKQVSVMTPEDVVLLKLLANRSKDRADVEDLLLVSGTLDLGYLRTWADRLGVRDRLEAAWKESGRAG